METTGAKIAKLRRRAGITQIQLADMIDTTQQQISAWEAGTRNPKIEAVMKIAEALGVDWLDILQPPK